MGIVNESGAPQEIADFIREHQIPYRQLLGDEKTQDAFGADQGFPTTFVIDGQGMIRKKVLGSPPGKFEVLQKTVDAALAAPQEK
jgi:peroxiredoxin